jgi:hypothetical protein
VARQLIRHRCTSCTGRSRGTSVSRSWTISFYPIESPCVLRRLVEVLMSGPSHGDDKNAQERRAEHAARMILSVSGQAHGRSFPARLVLPVPCHTASCPFDRPAAHTQSLTGCQACPPRF